MNCLIAFHYRSYGTFFYTKIVYRDLPTTNIIEPKRFRAYLDTEFCYYDFKPVFLVEKNKKTTSYAGG